MKKPALFDHRGNYQIVVDGAVKTFRRVSGQGALLDNRRALEEWRCRQVAIGLAGRPDLVAQVLAADGDKKTLGRLVANAEEVAGSRAGSNAGSSIHSLAEKRDLGQVIDLPEPWAADIQGYEDTLAAHDVVVLAGLVEKVVVIPDLELAGRWDRIVTFGDRHFVLDLKTGRTLQYSWGSIAVQLSCYARAESIYDPETCTHEPVPVGIDQDVALVAHIVPGAGRTDLYWVDIQAGWQAAQLAADVRTWRGRSDLADPWEASTPLVAPTARRKRLEGRVVALKMVDGAGARLAELWPAGVPTFKQSGDHTAEQMDVIAPILDEVEAEFALPFGDLDPATSLPDHKEK